jgi:exodeoxyribonuclease VIII
VGRAFHTLVLEPHLFSKQFTVSPNVDRRTKEGKVIWEDFVANSYGMSVLTEAELEMLQGMRYSIIGHTRANQVLSEEGDAEMTMVFTDEKTGLNLKGRADYITKSGLIVDVKTAEDASPDGFAKSCLAYAYHIQAQMYLRGYKAITGEDAKGFVFICVEKKPPYAVGVYVLDEQALIAGRIELEDNLALYAKCKETGQWPSYGNDEVTTVSLPYWYYKQKGMELYNEF